MRFSFDDQQGPLRANFKRPGSASSAPKLRVVRTEPSIGHAKTSGAKGLDHQPAASQPPESVALRSLFPNATFYGCNDLVVEKVAHSVGSAQEGELALYQIGEHDPVEFVATALARGVGGILTEQLLPCPIYQCVIGNLDHAHSELLAALHGQPAQQMLTVGVIGDSGKTTTCLLAATLTNAKSLRTAYQCDLASSDGVIKATSQQPTLAGPALMQWMGDANDCHSQVAIVELHANQAKNGLYDSIELDVLIVAGRHEVTQDFGPDVLDCVIDRLSPRGVIIHPDDDQRSIEAAQDANCEAIAYGNTPGCESAAMILDQSGGMSTIMLTSGDCSALMESSLCGLHMAGNIAAAAAFGRLIGMELQQIATHLSSMRSVPARGQRIVGCGDATVVLESAGTPVRIKSALRSAKASGVGGKTWCVLAIGKGDSDADLSEMGTLMERFADHCVVTAKQDSRGQFLQRAHQLLDGVRECAAMRLVAGRNEALHWALKHAKPRDTIVMITNRRDQSAFECRSEVSELRELIDQYREDHPSSAGDVQQKSGKISLKLFQ